MIFLDMGGSCPAPPTLVMEKSRPTDKCTPPCETVCHFSTFFFISKHDFAFYKQQIKMNILANIFPLVIVINPHSFIVSLSVLNKDFLKISSTRSSRLQLPLYHRYYIGKLFVYDTLS